MAKCILTYFLHHVEDKEIKALLQKALHLSEEFLGVIEDIFTRDEFPIPQGFSEKDINLGAPRLFQDEFYVHYLKYTSKAGMSIYNVAVPLVYRKDVKEFFTYCMKEMMSLIDQTKE
ncbi:DUF3231 family protein [Halalkalibacter oceani]|uniref:DUF3231 family protein n=1 Tax=Halalkalibacter oceani TaxID=1653776 RepID=UPI0032E80034